MYCPKCGKEVEAGDKFCSYCGATLQKVKTPERVEIAPTKSKVKVKASETAETVPSNTPRLMAWISFFIVLFVTGILVMIISRGKEITGGTWDTGTLFVVTVEIIGLGVWLLFCWLVGFYWHRVKGRSFGGGYAVSFFFSPIIGVFIGLLLHQDIPAVEQKKIESGEYKKCLYCAEVIKAEAQVCCYCGKEVK